MYQGESVGFQMSSQLAFTAAPDRQTDKQTDRKSMQSIIETQVGHPHLMSSGGANSPTSRVGRRNSLYIFSLTPHCLNSSLALILSYLQQRTVSTISYIGWMHFTTLSNSHHTTQYIHTHILQLLFPHLWNTSGLES